MIRPRHRRGRRLSTSVTLASAKGTVLSLVVAVVVLNGDSGTPSAAPDRPTADSSAYNRVVARAVADHDCSSDDLGAGVTPSSALIRTDSGEVEQVSFERGWDVYTGRAPGTLLAVCLDQP